MREYLLPYPYSLTILFLIVLDCTFLLCYKDKISWGRYLKGLVILFIFGVVQIHGMENIFNLPAWYFPTGSAFLHDIGFKIGNIAFEDLLFIPCCYSLFYAYLFLSEKYFDFVKSDTIAKSTTAKIMLISCYLIFEAMIGQSGGKSAEILILYYTFPIIIAFAFYCYAKSITINVSHMISGFLFIMFVNCGWELVNAVLRHWIYVYECEALGRMGWFFGNKLHISIFFQYGITGFWVMYASWIGFKDNEERLKF